MFTGQTFHPPDEEKKFNAKQWEMPFREDSEDFKAAMDARYKKAESAVCRSLMSYCEEKFIFQNESSQN